MPNVRGRLVAPPAWTLLWWSVSVACGAARPEFEAPALNGRLESTDLRAPGVLGRTDCMYGARACNACVDDVQRRFAAIGARPRTKFRLRTRERDRLPPHGARLRRLTASAHVQALMRLSGVDDDNWLVIVRSRLNQVGGGGFVLAKLDAFDGNAGEALIRRSDDDHNSTRFYYPMADTDHPGGAQMIGKTLVVGAECAEAEECVGPAFVETHDLSAPSDARKLHRLMLDGARGEPWQPPPGSARGYASATAMVQLADHHYLLFVTDRGRLARGWFYRSDRPSLDESTQWVFQQAWTAADDVLPHPDAWNGDYQNTSLITECGSGEIYLVAMGNPTYRGRFTSGTDLAHLYRLERSGRQRVGLRRVASRALASKGSCTLRAGSSVHVAPSGTLGIYCSANHTRPRFWFGSAKLRLAEFWSGSDGDP